MIDNHPSLRAVVEAIASDVLSGRYTHLPARVVAVDNQAQTVDAKVTVKVPYEGKLVELPLATHAPIAYMGAGLCRITFPVKVGDPVLLLFSSVSLDHWLTTGQDGSEPAHFESGQLSDAIAIPTLHMVTNPPTGVPQALTLWAPEVKLGGESANRQVAGISDLAFLKSVLQDALTSPGAIVPNDGGLALVNYILGRLTTWPTSSNVKIQ